MRKFIVILLIGCFLWPEAILAIGDQRCWTEDDCAKARAIFLGVSAESDEAKSGFLSGEDSTVLAACLRKEDSAKNKIGFCLPAGKTITRISFGDRREFSDIGDFIKHMYQYALWAATIIAVALIIISGMQWTASGGNADMIGSAKKRIAGAVSGLILLAFAYTILNTINPYLVNLRLPQAWLINTQGLVPPFCSQLKNEELLAFYKKSDAIISDKDTQDSYLKAQSQFTISSSFGGEQPESISESQYPKCGYDYFVEGSGGLSCKGSLCGKEKTCSAVVFENNNKGKKDVIFRPECSKGDLVVFLRLDDIFQTLGANLDSLIVNTFFHDQMNHPDWLDHGSGTGDNLSIYYSCPNVDSSVFPIELSDWNNKNWIAGWDYVPPSADNSLKGKAFNAYALNFKIGRADWGDKQKDDNGNTICPEKQKPTGVWVRIEIDEKSNPIDQDLFIGETADGKAMLGSWNYVKANPISMKEISETGVFFDAVVTADVIESVLSGNTTPKIYIDKDKNSKDYGSKIETQLK